MRGWIGEWAGRDSYDGRLETLLQGDLSRVQYVEIDYSAASATDPEPAWSGGVFDAIDHGIELDYADGRQVTLTWESPGYNHGLLVAEGRSKPHHVTADADVCIWDVTDRWREKGADRVIGVSSFWSRDAWSPGRTSDREVVSAAGVSDYLLDGICLEWRSGSSFVITLADRDYETGALQPTADNLAVLFSVEDARSAGVRLEDLIDVDVPPA